jgi:ribosomal protein S18 acetylase RimI-like enzyme
MQITHAQRDEEIREALTLLFARAELTGAEVERQVGTFLNFAAGTDLSLQHCLVARRQGRPISALLCLDAPGRTSSILLPDSSFAPGGREATVGLLAEAEAQARARGVHILQGLIPPESRYGATVFEAGGFAYLARLIYLEGSVKSRVLPSGGDVSLIWEGYSREGHDLFARVVEASYGESLDCSALNGKRDIEDILAGHRAAGVFDPDCWLMARAGAEPVGVLLLAHLPERGSVEVVYLGELPGCRGRGYGRAMMEKAMNVAGSRSVGRLTLAVVQRNTPARRLYARFDLRETLQRDAWIRFLSMPAGR